MNQHIWDPDVFYGIDADLDEFFESTPRVPTFACVVVPEADLEGDFEELCEIVYDQGHTLFVVEEAPLICKPGSMSPMFGKLVRTGRHHDIDLLWTAQRAAEVSRTLTSMTDFFVFYSQTEPRDLDAIAERCGREVADKVAGLGLHDSFTWDVIERKIIPDSPRLLKRDASAVRDSQNKIVGVIGRKGSGKSTRVHTFIQYVPRLVVFDPMEDHTTRHLLRVAEVPLERD